MLPTFPTAIKIITGDCGLGRATVTANGLTLPKKGGMVPFEQIVKITPQTRERRAQTIDRFKGAAGGGVIGGVAAGALAGGLTGPAGAVLGALAGAVLAVKRTYVTFRVDLADGRYLVGTGRKEVWSALEGYVKDSKPRRRWLSS